VLWPSRVLSPLWGRGDHLGEPQGWIDQLLPSADGLDPQARVELLCTAAMDAIEAADEPAAVTLRERLRTQVDHLADPYLCGVSQLVMAVTSGGIAGEYERTVREASLSLRQLRDGDEPLWTAMAALTLGGLETVAAKHDDAYRHLTEARDLADSFDNALVAAASRVSLGALLVEQRRLDEARAQLEQGLELSVEASSVYSICLCLTGFARLLFAEGNAERAALVAGAAQGLRERAGVKAWPSLRGRKADLAAHIRQVLGTTGFDEAFTTGSRLNRREAVAAVRDHWPAHDRLKAVDPVDAGASGSGVPSASAC
jgi:hypothetical protein